MIGEIRAEIYTSMPLCFRQAIMLLLRYIHFDVDLTTPWETPDGHPTNRHDALPGL